MLIRRMMQATVLGLAAVMMVSFFIIKDVRGDILEEYWRLDLMKAHWQHQPFTLPYFTPGHCNGFLLAADAQGLMFTLYMLISFLTANTLWVVKTTNLLLSVILIGGVYKWLGIFSIQNRFVLLFGGIMAAVSGYWMVNMTQGGHLWAGGFAYTPWVLWLMEYFLNTKPDAGRMYLAKLLGLAGLFFLLINSGYYWLQVAFPLIACRLLVFAGQGLFPPDRGEALKRFSTVCAAGLAGIMLSVARLGAIYEFQLKKFPRAGGAVNHYQVIGNNLALAKAYLVSFFDPFLTIRAPTDGMLGFMWDHNNYFGLVTLVPLIIGCFGLCKVIKNQAFWSLGLACLFQAGMTRTTHLADALRAVLPVFKQITWYWRGSGIMVLFLIVVMAMGFEQLIRSRQAGYMMALAVMAAICLDIFWVQAHQIDFTRADRFAYQEFPGLKSDTLTDQCMRCNLSNIFGYGDDYPPVLTAQGGSVSDVPAKGGPMYYNLYDVRRLAGHTADGGYYLTHDWPLFPRKDLAAFDKFIHYGQIIDLPLYLEVLNWLSVMAWILYLAGAVWVIRYGN